MTNPGCDNQTLSRPVTPPPSRPLSHPLPPGPPTPTRDRRDSPSIGAAVTPLCHTLGWGGFRCGLSHFCFESCHAPLMADWRTIRRPIDWAIDFMHEWAYSAVMNSTTAATICSNASQASRYASNTTQRISGDLFAKAQQLNQLMAEIAELASQIDANGNAPSREAAQNILAALS